MNTLDTMTRRRDASHTRDSEITDAPWPVTTKGMLSDYERLAATTDPSRVNLPMFALIRARKAIGDARIAVAYARRLNKAHEAAAARLAELGTQLDEMREQFPLTFL